MSGVDQKISGTAVKSVGERNIPWSQQVDEASYENLSSPANDDNSGNQSSMQFQFPPFNLKENNHLSSSNTGKGRKTSHNNDTKQKYGNLGSYNNSKRENHHINNAWNSRRHFMESTAPSNRINQNEDGKSSKLDKRTSEFVEVRTHASNAAPKKTTWASIASQPAKLTSKATFTASSHKKKGPGMPPPPMVPGKHDLDVNIWELSNNNPPPVPSPPLPIESSSMEPNYSSTTKDELTPSISYQSDKDECTRIPSSSSLSGVKPSPTSEARKNWVAQPLLHHIESRHASEVSAPPVRRIVSTGNPIRYNERRENFTGHRNEFEKNNKHEYRDENIPRVAQNSSAVKEVVSDPQILLDELKDKNNYNPTEIDLEKAAAARFFVIKSYSEDDIHRSIKYEIWCSTDHGNKRLDDAFKERYKEGGNILLFFSVNSSGHFCGMAQMMTSVDYNSTSSVWSQDKWRGKFKVKWIYVKDVPNGKLRHIRLENNDNKPVTYSRDTQEVQNLKGIEVLQILHSYKHTTSIFDDFSHYEKKQEEEVSSKRPTIHVADVISQSQVPINRHFNRQNDDRERERNVRESHCINSTQKNSFSGGNSFRDRNLVHKSGAGSGNYNNSYSDYRQRFEKDILQSDRENHFGIRHGSNRKDDHSHSHSTTTRTNKRDFNTEPIKTDVRLKSGLSTSRDLPKVCINP